MLLLWGHLGPVDFRVPTPATTTARIHGSLHEEQCPSGVLQAVGLRGIEGGSLLVLRQDRDEGSPGPSIKETLLLLIA